MVTEYSFLWHWAHAVVPRVWQAMLGDSAWRTFAPISAIRQPAKGPAMLVPETNTLTPWRTPNWGYSFQLWVSLLSICLNITNIPFFV